MSSQWNLVQSIWHFMDRHPQQGYMTNKCSWCCYSIDFDFDFAEKVYKNQEKLENILQLTRKETVRKIAATSTDTVYKLEIVQISKSTFM